MPCDNSHTDKVKITIDQCTGIGENPSGTLALKVIPNPANSRINFEISGMENNRDLTLTMSNSQGTSVFTMKLPVNEGIYSNSMDISRFPRGIYYFKVGDRQEQVIQKVIFQ